MGRFSKLIDMIKGVTDVAKNATDPKQYLIKVNKNNKYRLEAAMQYVFVDERSGKYKDFDDEKIEKYKVHFRKRIFDVS